MLRSMLFLSLILLPSSVFANEKQQDEKRDKGEQKPNIVRLGFPACAVEDPAEFANSRTGWEIEWDLTSQDNNKSQKDPGSLLRIVRAKFHWKDKDNQPKSMNVVRNMWLAEAFTPYDDTLTAFFDMAAFNFKTLKADRKLLGPSCVLPGEILTSTNPHFDGLVYKEVHDDGVRWTEGSKKEKSKEESKLQAYRGQKLMLWSLFEASNYVYVIEYDFTDDGRILCRLGFTGFNYYSRGFGGSKDRKGKFSKGFDSPKRDKAPDDKDPKDKDKKDNTPEPDTAKAKDPKEKTPDDGDVHVHIGCWRMDFDLGDPAKNEYQLVRRYLDLKDNRFRVAASPFNQGREGKAEWRAEEFTTLRAQSGSAKSLGDKRPVAYDLIPVRMGSVRQLFPTGQAKPPGAGKGGFFKSKSLNADMDFINYDFWVTRTPAAGKQYYEVPSLAAEKKELKGQPATIWYNAPALHVPRGEDFGSDGANNRRGVALTTVIEFTLRPRDLFDSTPLYP